jgi:SAM-dependent methyltransferase
VDAEQWNERYQAASSVWSGEPNRALVSHAPAPPHPGSTALDLGCGEGGDALWLAARGWYVIGVDWAGVALERARRAAAESGSRARFVEGDITDATFLATLSDTGTFDLVTVAFLHPEPEERSRMYGHLPTLLAPGGHLVVVAHDPQHGSRGLAGPQHHRLLSADDIVAALALPAGYEVLVVATTEQANEGEVTAVDSVVVLQRGPAG